MSKSADYDDVELEQDQYGECDECFDFISLTMTSIYKELIPKLIKDYNLDEKELIKIRKKWYNNTPIENVNKQILMDDFRSFKRMFQ